jgi:hypothetical protein
MIEKGVLVWCDGNGVEFTDIAELEKAKRSGRAYIRVSDKCCLPTVYQLTGDVSWDECGVYWELYDLRIEESDRCGVESTVLPEMETQDYIRKNSEHPNADGAVKVLSEKTGSNNNFQNDSLDSKLDPAGIDNLADEFSGLLQMN